MKLKATLFLIFCAISISSFAQTSKILLLESKRENFQKLLRSYQDSLADLDYIIAELKKGNSVNYEEVDYFKNVETESVIKNPAFDQTSKSTITSKVPKQRPNYIAPIKINKTISSKKRAPAYSNNKESKTFQNSPKPKVQIRKYKRRVGATCRDGTRSYATGRGACSHHGGVRQWLYN